MNWPFALLFLYLLLGIEMGLKEALSFGSGGATPSLLIPFLVFVALFAPPTHSIGLALFAGLLLDLAAPRGNPPLTIVGPHMLAMLGASYTAITMRNAVIRRNPLTLIFLSLIGAIVAQVILVTVFSVRSFYPGRLADPFAFDPTGQLLARLLAAVCTGIAAVVLSLAFLAVAPVFQFRDPHGHRFGPRQ